MKMIVKDSHSTPSSGAFKPRKLVEAISSLFLFFLFLFLCIYHYKLVKHSIQYFFKSSILVQMLSYFSSSIQEDINLLFLSLNVLTYLLTLGNIKTNALIASSKYLIKYLELIFVSINFEIIIASTSTS